MQYGVFYLELYNKRTEQIVILPGAHIWLPFCIADSTPAVFGVFAYTVVCRNGSESLEVVYA